MTDERDRATILARRRRFLAVALAGIAVQGCDPKPRVCLKQAPPPTVQVPEEDAGTEIDDAGLIEEAGTEDATTPEPEPTVCLSPPVEPQVCLRLKAPPNPPPPPPGPPKPAPKVCLLYQ